MKVFVLLVVLQATILVAVKLERLIPANAVTFKGNGVAKLRVAPDYSSKRRDISVATSGNYSSTDNSGSTTSSGSNRDGRIFASFGKNIQQNTATAVSELERVASTVGNASVQIESLLTTLSTSDAQILSAVSAIDTSLAASGAIATKLDTISTSLGSILTAVTDSTTPGTLLNQLSSLYTLLDTKLSNFEQIFGYDDYPPAPSF